MKTILVLAVLVAMLAIPNVVCKQPTDPFNPPAAALDFYGVEDSKPGFSELHSLFVEEVFLGISDFAPGHVNSPQDPYAPIPEIALADVGVEDYLPGFSEVGFYDFLGPGLSFYAMPSDPY